MGCSKRTSCLTLWLVCKYGPKRNQEDKVSKIYPKPLRLLTTWWIIKYKQRERERKLNGCTILVWRMLDLPVKRTRCLKRHPRKLRVLLVTCRAKIRDLGVTSEKVPHLKRDFPLNKRINTIILEENRSVNNDCSPSVGILVVMKNNGLWIGHRKNVFVGLLLR